MRLTLGVLKGALLGGIIAIIGSVLVITVAGALAGQGLLGLAGALYYSGMLFLYVCPIGLLIGAVIAGVRIVRRALPPSENGVRGSRLTYGLWLGIPLLVIIG